jgi:hypothetical protein
MYVVRIFRGALKLHNLGVFGRFAAAVRVLIVKEQTLPAHENSKVRGLVHFSAERHCVAARRRPKTWTCPLALEAAVAENVNNSIL